MGHAGMWGMSVLLLMGCLLMGCGGEVSGVDAGVADASVDVRADSLPDSALPEDASLDATLDARQDADATVEPGDCPPGAFDLGAMTNPNGVTEVVLGTVPLPTSTDRHVGRTLNESAVFQACVPEDIVNVVWIARVANESFVFFVRYREAGGADIIDSSTILSIDQTVLQYYNDRPTRGRTRLAPASGLGSISPGVYEFVIAAEAAEAEFSALVRRGPKPALNLSLNFVFVEGSTATTAEIDRVFGDTTLLTTLTGRLGLTIDGIGFGEIDDASFARLDIRTPQTAAIAAATIRPMPGRPPPIAGALPVFVTSEVKNSQGCVGGVSPGIPGSLGNPDTFGVALAWSAWRVNGSIFSEGIWIATAHEIGHWLGLSHTTFRRGQYSDLLNDTPTCPDANDANGDGELAPDECMGFGVNNLMFWAVADLDPVVTDDQRALVELNFTTGL
ncbi:MAG: hypothetical protein AAGF12_42985 [Myxococcota bacterium]